MPLSQHIQELQNALDKGMVKAMELYVQDEAGYVRNPWLTKGDKIVNQIEQYESLYGANFVHQGSLMELRNRGKQGLYLTLHAPDDPENTESYSLVQNAPYLLNINRLTPNPEPEFMDAQTYYIEHCLQQDPKEGHLFDTLIQVKVLHPIVEDQEYNGLQGGLFYNGGDLVFHSIRENGVSLKRAPDHIGVLCATGQDLGLTAGQVTGKIFTKPELADIEVTVTGAPGQDPYDFYDEDPKFTLRFDINTQEMSAETLDNLLEYLVHELPEDKERLFDVYRSLNQTHVDVSDLDQLNQQTR